MTSELFIQIDWSELDLFGHVNNVMFFRYMQASRLKYCEALGLTSLNEQGKLSFLVASSKCDFRRALYYPGSVCVKTCAVRCGNTSFVLRHVIEDGEHKVAAEGEDVLVLYDYGKSAKVTIDSQLRSRMAI